VGGGGGVVGGWGGWGGGGGGFVVGVGLVLGCLGGVCVFWWGFLLGGCWGGLGVGGGLGCGCGFGVLGWVGGGGGELGVGVCLLIGGGVGGGLVCLFGGFLGVGVVEGLWGVVGCCVGWVFGFGWVGVYVGEGGGGRLRRGHPERPKFAVIRKAWKNFQLGGNCRWQRRMGLRLAVERESS